MADGVEKLKCCVRVIGTYNYLGEEMDSFGLVLKDIANLCI